MKQSSPSIARNYIYNTLYQILILLTPLLTTPYISRVLGADGIGVYSYTQSIASYFVLLGAVGTTLYGQREIAYVCDNPDTRTKIFWEIVVFRFAAVLLCTLIYFFTFGFDNQYSLIYRILTIEVFATAIDISWFFMGMENFRIDVYKRQLQLLFGNCYMQG